MDAVDRTLLRNSAAAVFFLLAWGLFLAGASPTLYGGDSGELIASSVGLGISHAPGYALQALAGKSLAAAIAWGSPAYRVNLGSGLISALTVAGLFLLLRRWTGAAVIAAFGAFLYAALPLVWDQAQTTEVFAFNNLLALGLLYAFDNAVRGRGNSEAWLLLFSFVLGLGLAHHHTLILLTPGFALWAFVRGRDSSSAFQENVAAYIVRWLKRLPRLLAFLLLGYSLALYLPLRAARHPAVNFGDPHTARRFFDILTRKEFGSLELHPSALPFRDVETLSAQAGSYFRQMRKQWPIGGLLLGAGGFLCFLLGRRSSGSAALGGPSPGAWLLFWVFSGPVFYFYSNLSPFNTLAQWRLERFFLLPFLFWAGSAALALGRLWQTKGGKFLAAFLFLFAAFGEVFIERPWFRWDFVFRDFGRNLTASLAPRSLLLIDRVMFDEPTSCLLNALTVERRRPDLRVVYRPGTLFELFYGEDYLEIPRDGRVVRQEEREKQLWASSDRPVAALAFVRENLPTFPFQLRGLLYQAQPGTSPVPFYLDRGRPRLWPDYPSRLISVHTPYYLAKEAFESEDMVSADRWSRRAGDEGNDMEWLQSNLGALWSRWSASHLPADPAVLDRAGHYFARAASIDPYFSQASFGLGYARLQQKRYGEAIGAFTRAARCRPDWPEAYYMWGVACSAAGQKSAAREPLERFLQLAPGSPLASDVRAILRGS